MSSITTIQAPNGIRFDCSGCANCCLEWPVPITSKDYERISALEPAKPISDFTRSLRSRRENLNSFTHTLEKQADGRCFFLTEDKRCLLHRDFGLESKPSMCRLFPYTFTVTPDLVLASVSFASSAVLFNSGTLLSRQLEMLQEQYALFQSLFEPKSELWHKVQLIDGQSISWDELVKQEKVLMDILYDPGADEEQAPRLVWRKLERMSLSLSRLLSSAQDAEREPNLESRPKIVDQILLKHLDALYFPENLLASDNFDLDAHALLKEVVSAPEAVDFGQGRSKRPFSELIALELGKLPPEIEELIDRFLYQRFFAKLYFGPGFHHLSWLAGLHHLYIIGLLLRLKLKQMLSGPAHELRFDSFCEILRVLERRLTQLDLSGASLSCLEVFLSSRRRLERIWYLGQ